MQKPVDLYPLRHFRRKVVRGELRNPTIIGDGETWFLRATNSDGQLVGIQTQSPYQAIREKPWLQIKTVFATLAELGPREPVLRVSLEPVTDEEIPIPQSA